MDERSPVDIIYSDLQKAFDKVPHQRLILKLKSHGLRISKINWIEQWLTDRRQRVVVDGEVSIWKSVLSGVPQGSVFLTFRDHLHFFVGQSLPSSSSTVCFQSCQLSVRICSYLLGCCRSISAWAVPFFSSPVRPCP